MFGQLKDLDILMVQEVHGSEEEFAQEMASLSGQFVWVFSGGGAGDTGGVAIVVRRSLVAELVSEEMVGGRMLRATVRCRSGATWHRVNLHNFGHRVKQLAVEAMASPLDTVLWVAGDMNADAPGEGVRAAPHLQRGSGASAPRRRAHASLESLLKMLTEVDQPVATRMAEAASAALSRIDRIYVSAPGWVIQQLRIYSHIDRPPDRMLADRLSDHSLVAVSWQRRRSEPARQRQLPQHVYKSAV